MESVSTGESPTYTCFPRPEWRIFVPTLVVIVTATWALVHFDVRWYWITLADVVLFLTGLSVSWWAVIEVGNGLVRERAMFFRRKILTERVTPFAEFKELFCRLDTDETMPTKYWVGLRHPKRGAILVKDCGKDPSAAEELAWKISHETGIPLKGNPLSKEQFISDDKKFET